MTSYAFQPRVGTPTVLNLLALDNLSTALELLWYIGLWCSGSLPRMAPALSAHGFLGSLSLRWRGSEVDVLYLLAAPWELTVDWDRLAHLWVAGKMVLQSCTRWLWWEVSRSTGSPPVYHLPGDQGPNLGFGSTFIQATGVQAAKDTTP